MKFKRLIPPIIADYYNKVLTPKNQKYKVGMYPLNVPENYGNIKFQNEFRLYDRFLPFLAGFLNTENYIIDIGANVGDTTIALLQECNNRIISIEGSSCFFKYLTENIKLMPTSYQERVKTYNYLIGTGKFNGTLNHENWGTAQLQQIDKESPNMLSLDKLIEEKNDICLLKVDVDGFDFDVINSSVKILQQSKPILFFENDVYNDNQLEGFKELYLMLENLGYEYLYIFDNFGNLIFQKTSYQTLQSLTEYIYTMKKYNCTRTIYYTDVLTCTKKDIDIIENAVGAFKEKLIHQINLD